MHEARAVVCLGNGGEGVRGGFLDGLRPPVPLRLDLPNDDSSHGCARLLILVVVLLLATFKLFPVW